jgi:hypothetical protein
MRDYRFNFVDFEGRITHAKAVQCLDDLDALAEGERVACTDMIEIWDGSRIVARVKPGNAPLQAGDTKCL